MSVPIYIPDIIGECVKATEKVVLPKLVMANRDIAALNYQFGHPKEIDINLFQMGGAPEFSYLKYPMVWLVTDFAEQKGGQVDFYEVTRLRIIIATMTRGTMKGYERLAQIFKPILYPIYNELLNQISSHPAVHTQSVATLQHTKWDRYYWGSQPMSQNAMNDYLDAIEIENLTLQINNQYCTPPSPTNGVRRLIK